MKRSSSSSGHYRRTRAEYWRRRRIALVVVVLIVATPFVLGLWYASNVADAIGNAQDVAVHDLPTRIPRTPTAAVAPALTAPAEGSPVASVAASAVVGPARPTAGPTVTSVPTRRTHQSPSSFDVARGLLDASRGAENVSASHVWPGQRYLTIMVLGVDTRGDGSDENADTIILARLDLEAQTLYSISIPRDLQVDIPGHGPGKINGAYGIGLSENPEDPIAGVVKMRDTIEVTFGVLIDYYVMVDFNGFRDVVDAVGGITIDVPKLIIDEEYPTEDYGTRRLVIQPGIQHMDGETALAYARTRHGDSDDQRRERQMQVIRAVMARGQDIGSMTRMTDIISALGNAAFTNFHWDEQLALASMALRFDPNNVHMYNLGAPYITPGTSADGLWIYEGDIPTIADYIEQVLSGQVPDESLPSAITSPRSKISWAVRPSWQVVVFGKTAVALGR